MSWSPAAVPRDGQSQVEIVHELPYVPTKFKPSLAILSISPTRVGVHHGHWKAVPPEEIVGVKTLGAHQGGAILWTTPRDVPSLEIV